MERTDLFHMALLERRACAIVWGKLGVNRFEQWLLQAMAGQLALLGRAHVGQDDLFKMITGNRKQHTKMFGYWKGLQTAGMIASKPAKSRGTSWFITPLGYKCLDLFNDAFQALDLRYRTAKSIGHVVHHFEN